MRTFYHVLVVFLLLSFSAIVTTDASANQRKRSSWGWDKPLNAKLGLFYTSNRGVQQQPRRSYQQSWNTNSRQRSYRLNLQRR
jgi:hypothetical protein